MAIRGACNDFAARAIVSIDLLADAVVAGWLRDGCCNHRAGLAGQCGRRLNRSIVAGMMQELEVTFSRVMSVWWLCFWRATVGATVLGGIAGFILGFAIEALDFPLEWSPKAGGMAGGIIGFLWFIVVVRMALRKKYRKFRIALLPHS